MANIAFIGGNNPLKLGISCLSSYLKSKGHNVVYCGNFIDTRFFKAQDDFNIREYIKDMPIDLFAFSVMSHDYIWSVNTANRLKKQYPNIPIAFGGPVGSILPEIALDNPAVDYVCVGDGEEPLEQLLSCVGAKSPQEEIGKINNICYRDRGKKVMKKGSFIVKNLDEYPYPDFEIFRKKTSSYHFQYPIIITSRGCPFSCTYCSASTLRGIYSEAGKYVRQHSVEYVIDFLSLMKKNYKAKAFQFMDDVFTLDKKWLLNFLDSYNQKVRLPFTCITNPLTIDEDVVRALSKSRCRLVYIGLQSGSERIRRLIKRKETDEMVYRMAALFKKYRVVFSINHIFDFPFDSDREDYESAVFYSKVKPDLIDTFSLFYLPKSEIINDGLAHGILTDKDIVDSNLGFLMDYQRTNKVPGRKSHYERHNIFFNLIPVIPGFLLQKFLRNQDSFIRASRLFNFVPARLSALIKLLLSVKNRCFLVQKAFFPDAVFFLQAKLKNSVSPKRRK
ncbi:MAG: radical SAM protein [Candidatus Omnitrophota bacterium]